MERNVLANTKEILNQSKMNSLIIMKLRSRNEQLYD